MIARPAGDELRAALTAGDREQTPRLMAEFDGFLQLQALARTAVTGSGENPDDDRRRA